MSDETQVYDLGVVDAEQERTPPPTWPRTTRGAAAGAFSTTSRSPRSAIADSLALFLPGGGQLLRAQWSDGMFVLSGAGLLLALAWAVWETQDRLAATLTALGWPAQAGVYALALIYIGLAVLHTGNVLYGTSRGSARAHPLVAGCGSALFPGWGQLLNQQPVKATAFVGGMWITGILWLLASPWARVWFAGRGVAVPPGLDSLASPALLWSVPIVLWVLSLYDAVSTARR